MTVRAALAAVLCAACVDGTPDAFGDRTAHAGSILAAPRPASSPLRQDANAQIAAGRRSAIVEAAARVSPAVVSVNVIRRVRQVVGPSVFDFFAVPRAYEREVQGIGSGFIVSSDGLVITNQHVTEGAAEIVVTTRDGTDYPAELLGEDALTDIAVLRIEGAGLGVAPLGRSEDLQIGEWVVAIGNPYGYLLGNTEPTVTAGVVSGVGRNIIPSGDQSGIYVGMIQTDASVNPGNSGGPLANALGEVVGVNSSIFSASGGSVGIGFAIPIERALRVANELRRHGAVRRAWMGVDVSGADRLRDWKRLGGLGVTDVAPGSPAARAGLRGGDVLEAANGSPMRTFLDWEAVKLDVSPGDTVRVAILRDGDAQRVQLVVEDVPTSRAEKIATLGGIELVSVSAAVRQERSIRSDRGALIYRLSEETARITGLRSGDVILQINRVRIADAADVQRAFEAAAGGSAIRVYFERGGRIGTADFYVR